MTLPFTDEEMLVILESASFAMRRDKMGYAAMKRGRLADHLSASDKYLDRISGKLNSYLNEEDFSNIPFDNQIGSPS